MQAWERVHLRNFVMTTSQQYANDADIQRVMLALLNHYRCG